MPLFPLPSYAVPWSRGAIVLALTLSAAFARPAPQMSWIENEFVRVGVDLNLGGAITSIVEKEDGRELVNSYDLGREIQMSFYGGPTPFEPDGKKAHPQWRNLGWNPIQSGDWAGNPSKVLEHRNGADELFTRSIPMQWPLEGVPGDCQFESRIRLEGRAIILRCKLINQRKDQTFYPAKHQELPAVYANGAFSKVTTYSGDRPFTSGALSEWIEPGPPWRNFHATEHWAALVDSQNRGLGVWQPDTTSWIGGTVVGNPAKQGPLDNATAYVAPITLEHLDPQGTLEYETRLVAGTVPQIRALVLQWESARGLPHSLMKHDRAGWSLRGGRDSGTPFPGMWKIEASGGALVLVGPTTFWRAEKGGRLRVRGRVRSGNPKGGRLQIVWKSLHPAGKEEGAPFEWHPHTELGQTAFDLGSKPGYTGGLVQLTLRFEGLVPGDAVEIESVGLEP